MLLLCIHCQSLNFFRYRINLLTCLLGSLSCPNCKFHSLHPISFHDDSTRYLNCMMASLNSRLLFVENSDPSSFTVRIGPSATWPDINDSGRGHPPQSNLSVSIVSHQQADNVT